MDIRIETKDLILRKIELGDTYIFHDIRNENYVLKWMPDWKSTIEGTRLWIDAVINFYDKQDVKNLWCQLAIERKTDGQVMGIISLQTKAKVNNEIEIAYFISEKYSGKGYMRQAAEAIIKWGFEKFNIPFITAIVEVENYQSQKVVEAVGFKQIERRSILNSGESVEKLFYYYRFSKREM